MKMLRKSAALIALLLVAAIGRANEGMWLLHMLQKINEAEMQGMGLHLSAEDIYSINNASLKDAIVMLNGGMCTAEMISSEGLVLTNHHCAYDAIQSLSSEKNDYLTDGFWAYSKDQELPIEGMTTSFLLYIEDVTSKVLQNVSPSMSEEERGKLISAAIKEVEAAVTAEGKGEPKVKSFYYGNEFYLFVYKTYRDVRLVGAPPSSIGKFGGDTDNWMWPRHTGDFSMLRIYADGSNEPADFSKDNIAFKPKHHLPVSTAGVKNGDFTMIMGYPGSTDRFLSSWGVQEAIDISNPTVVDIRDTKLKTMKQFMDADRNIGIKYASDYASVANYWKYFIGQTKGLKRLDVYQKKKDIEAEFTKWVNADASRSEKYGNALNLMAEYYAENGKTELARIYVNEAGFGCNSTILAWRFNNGVASSYDPETKGYNKEAVAAYKEQLAALYKDYDPATEKAIMKALFKMWQKNVDKAQQPDFFRTIDAKYKGSVDLYVDKLFATSFVVSQERMNNFLAKPSKKVADKDMAVITMNSIISCFRTTLRNPSIGVKYEQGYRLFVDGLRQMQPKKKWYPDANSTMRLTYGKVGDYIPADAVQYDYLTTAEGILQKEDPKNEEFVVPQKLIDLLEKKDYGNYANEKGELPVCFISDNDITGGNSGSPVINGDGHLVGLAFDGNWEAMSGDIAFEPELQRTISVDIRYVLFIVDKFAGAKNLINEMTLANKPVGATPVKAVLEHQ